MTFNKPTERYVDMAKYIDDNVYTENCDENIIYEYLYQLANMLAHKNSFFTKKDDYDYFSIYAANHLWFRLNNPKQFELNSDGSPSMQKIKSILNYIKKTIYPMKVDFEQEHYCSNISTVEALSGSEALTFSIMRSADALNVVEFSLHLGDCIQTIHEFLKSLPYEYKSKTWNNIYLSCLLTFLNSVTLSNKQKARIKHLDEINMIKDYLLEEMLQEESENAVILYHLDDSFHDYIFVLNKRIKHAIAADLSSCLHSHIYSEAVVTSMLMDSLDYCKEDLD